MGKVAGFIIILLFIIFTFVSAYNLYQNSYAVQDINYTLSLSAKVLANCIEVDSLNYSNLSYGYDTQSGDIKVDKEKLIKEFNKVLYTNYYNDIIYEKIKKNILIKMLVYSDRFYMADTNDKWSPPYFFTTKSGGAENQIIYLSSESELGYYYDSSGDKVYKHISHFGITNEEKHQVIIDKINSVIAQNTTNDTRKRGLKIEIFNPFNDDGKYRDFYSRFNVLEGLTFFVIHGTDKRLYIDRKEFKYKNCSVVGYTMNYLGN